MLGPRRGAESPSGTNPKHRQKGDLSMLGFWGFMEAGWWLLLAIMVILVVVFLVVRKKQKQQ